MGAITFSHGVAGVIGTGLRAASAILDGKQKELLNKNVPEIKIYYFFFFKQKTPYEISECDWSSDVCSSDRSEEHTSELQSHSEISYADFCLSLETRHV